MMHNVTGCLICGLPLKYELTESRLHCSICGSLQSTAVKCVNNHFVCDDCHSVPGNDWIQQICAKSDQTDPFELSVKLMENPVIKMHGPEHHYLVPAVMLTVFYNSRGETDKKENALLQARKRAEKVPGGFCGFCGNCGAAVGTGIFLSIILGANPVSEESWRLCNLMTAESLMLVAENGGPRCCKRDTFLSIQSGIAFLRKHLNFDLGSFDQPVCTFSDKNKQCRLQDCPYYFRK
jgi:hypothetical protein